MRALASVAGEVALLIGIAVTFHMIDKIAAGLFAWRYGLIVP